MNLTGLNAATSTGFSKAQPSADFGASGGGIMGASASGG